jgi:nicotinamidase-related amidase
MDWGGLRRDTWDTAVLAELDVRADDVVIDKCRFNAFQATSLQMVLRSRGIDELHVAGLLTNVCVESTVRSARELDYDVTVLADCVTTRSERLHNASLESMREGHFADLAPWREILGA